MRKFNPEKELRKIQHGNRNKIIAFISLLLIMGVIGYSFALYQVRYSKRIIYTKVAPFNIRDVNLAVKIKGEQNSRDTFPLQTENYLYADTECEKENITTVTWDETEWTLDLKTKGPNKCTVIFKPGKKLGLYLESLNAVNFIVDGTSAQSKRYVGANPNNYIWFNCKSYEGLTTGNGGDGTHSCEKWRIIGLMKNITKTNGSTPENLVKIIRSDSIGTAQWDSAGGANWATASLQQSLNITYYNGNKLLNGNGITTATKEMIEEVTWDISGTEDNTRNTYQFYNEERRGAKWNGYIGLMYPSDFAMATEGNNSGTTRDACLTSDSIGNYDLNKCYEKDWLSIGKSDWTITIRVDNRPFFIVNGQFAGSNVPTLSNNVRPTLYLKSSVAIKLNDGDGSVNKPYVISV